METATRNAATSVHPARAWSVDGAADIGGRPGTAVRTIAPGAVPADGTVAPCAARVADPFAGDLTPVTADLHVDPPAGSPPV